MNPEGTKRNLKPPPKGNSNAEKSGLHSKRRRAEQISKAKTAIKKDPKTFLAQDRVAVLAEEVGLSELLAKDIAELGVTDRKGNLRRSVGAYARNLQRRHDLNQELEADLAASATESRHAEPWTRDEGLRLLRNIAHNYASAAASSIKAIELLNQQALDPTTHSQLEWIQEIDEMSSDELERDLKGFLKPFLSGKPRNRMCDAREMIRSLAERASIEKKELLDLLDVVVHETQFYWDDPVVTIRRLGSEEEISMDDLRGLCLDLMWEFPLGLISQPASLEDPV